MASVIVGGETFSASEDAPFIFGRADADGVVGLDPNDMGISAVAGSIQLQWGVWWVINASTKRPLLLEAESGRSRTDLFPGERYAITNARLNVLVVGSIYTHVLEVVLPDAYAAALQDASGRLTTGTLVGAQVALSDRERAALVALFAGYLTAFPHRREHPNTYDDASRLLDDDTWTADRVRKAVERVKARFALKHNLYFEGPQANYELAAHLISTGALSGKDLALVNGKS